MNPGRPFFRALLMAAFFSTLLAPEVGMARAPDDFEEAYARPTVIESPERFQLEVKVGRYEPDFGGEFDRFYDEAPWMLSVELDANLVRIPYFGTLGVGGGWGWARARGNTLQADGDGTTDEAAKLILYPLSALGVLRIDALVRHLNVPLIFTGKLGYDFIRWRSETGSRTEDTGFSVGLRWAAQIGLDLNFMEPAAARNLDEEWGINRTFLLVEYYGSQADQGDSLPLGDTTFSFGLGLIF